MCLAYHAFVLEGTYNTLHVRKYGCVDLNMPQVVPHSVCKCCREGGPFFEGNLLTMSLSLRVLKT